MERKQTRFVLIPTTVHRRSLTKIQIPQMQLLFRPPHRTLCPSLPNLTRQYRVAIQIIPPLDRSPEEEDRTVFLLE
jgi:hypothetical protein